MPTAAGPFQAKSQNPQASQNRSAASNTFPPSSSTLSLLNFLHAVLHSTENGRQAPPGRSFGCLAASPVPHPAEFSCRIQPEGVACPVLPGARSQAHSQAGSDSTCPQDGSRVSNSC